MSSFEMIGKLSLIKGSEKFPCYEEKKIGDNGVIKVVRMDMKANGNSHNVKIEGAFWGEDSLVYTMKKVSDNKYENIKFPYKEREKHIDDVAEFKKYVFVNGEDRMEFVTQQELAEFVHNELQKEEYKGKRFIIKGDIESSEYKNKVYNDFNITRMYVVNDDIKEGEEKLEDKSEGQLDFYITEGCLDDETFDETRKMFINGFIGKYDSKKKADVGIRNTIEVHIPEEKKNADKLVARIRENLETENEDHVYKLGVKVELISKSESVEFDLSMATDEEREDLELELITIEDLKAQYGCGKGSFEKKFLFKGWARGYSKGAIEQQLTLAELIAKEAPKQEESNEFEIDENEDFEFEDENSNENDDEDYGL